jgi:RNA polymerase sigma-70 factor (ECF subfamily)
LNSFSDEQLVKSCVAGIQEHCRLLYERYKDYVAGRVWRLVRDVEVTRDLTQETFLRAFKGLKRFRAESSFKTWLYRIAVNVCKDHWRMLESRHGKSHVVLDDDEDYKVRTIAAESPATNSERLLLQKELKIVVEAAIDKLSPDHKTVILLWIEGYSYDEIAEITATPQKTIGTRLYYAKKKLRDLLKQYLMGKDRCKRNVKS